MRDVRDCYFKFKSSYAIISVVFIENIPFPLLLCKNDSTFLKRYWKEYPPPPLPSIHTGRLHVDFRKIEKLLTFIYQGTYDVLTALFVHKKEYYL